MISKQRCNNKSLLDILWSIQGVVRNLALKESLIHYDLITLITLLIQMIYLCPTDFTFGGLALPNQIHVHVAMRSMSYFPFGFITMSSAWKPNMVLGLGMLQFGIDIGFIWPMKSNASSSSSLSFSLSSSLYLYLSLHLYLYV